MPSKGRRYGDATPSLDDIVTAALALLDEGGRPGLTIARLAARLDSYPANLYRRFTDMDELLGHVAARIFEEIGGGPDPDADPVAALLDFALRCRDGWLAHPRAISLLFHGHQEALAEPLEAYVTVFRRIATSDARLVAAIYEYTTLVYGAIFLGAAPGWGYDPAPARPESYPNTAFVLGLAGQPDRAVPAGEPFRAAVTRAIRLAIDG
ncbi:MAG TPA: TetR/AcrR family transcriptional regulator [Mycobacteriales bacterium]|nr:TetR/AcrR family transcriptional regulator [Mycobacteriales bacterium]